jgi:hypothetical protein
MVTEMLMNKESYSPDSTNLNLKHHNICHSMQYSPVQWGQRKQNEKEQNTYIQLQY